MGEPGSTGFAVGLVVGDDVAAVGSKVPNRNSGIKHVSPLVAGQVSDIYSLIIVSKRVISAEYDESVIKFTF